MRDKNNNNKTFFLNVDTQNDFMNPDGALYVPDADMIKLFLSKVTSYIRKNNILSINTADWHRNDADEFSNNPDFINTFPPHCLANTFGASYIKETNPNNPIYLHWDKIYNDDFYNDLKSKINNDHYKQSIVIYKDKFDVFDGNPNTTILFRHLKYMGYTNAVVYGVSGEICVKYAVDGLLERGFNVSLMRLGIKSINPDKFDDELNTWKRYINFEPIKNNNTYA